MYLIASLAGLTPVLSQSGVASRPLTDEDVTILRWVFWIAAVATLPGVFVTGAMLLSSDRCIQTAEHVRLSKLLAAFVLIGAASALGAATL